MYIKKMSVRKFISVNEIDDNEEIYIKSEKNKLLI